MSRRSVQAKAAEVAQGDAPLSAGAIAAYRAELVTERGALQQRLAQAQAIAQQIVGRLNQNEGEIRAIDKMLGTARPASAGDSAPA